MTYVTSANVQELEEIGGMTKPEMTEPGWFTGWGKLQEKLRPQVTYVLRGSGTGESISCLRLFWRMIASPQRRLRVAGIGGVWTRPEMRGQGYGTLLMEKAMTKLQEDAHSADLVVLHAPKARGLYSRQGFVEIESGMFAATLHQWEELLHMGQPYQWKLLPEGHF